MPDSRLSEFGLRAKKSVIRTYVSTMSEHVQIEMGGLNQKLNKLPTGQISNELIQITIFADLLLNKQQSYVHRDGEHYCKIVISVTHVLGTTLELSYF